MEQRVYEFLSRPKKFDMRIKMLEAKRAGLMSCLLPSGIRYDLDKVQSSPEDPMSRVAAEIDAIDREIISLQQEKAGAIVEICDAIDQLTNGNEKTVLTLYWVHGHKLADIAEIINYSVRRTYYFRKQGVIHLGEVLDG